MITFERQTGPQKLGVQERAWPIVSNRQFILATRETGYRSLSAAVSELIDNSLQAGASNVFIFVHEERREEDTKVHGSRRRVSIAVLDDGAGMDAHGLRTALQFGGSERFNDRRGAGRFGMGLPNSSVSQSSRLEVFTWKKGRPALFCYLDVAEIASGVMKAVPEPAPSTLPAWVQSMMSELGAVLPRRGTLVHWPMCDRLPFRKASTVRLRLSAALGRTYRYVIRSGTRISINGVAVESSDPLMRWGASAAHGVASEYGDELRYDFKVPQQPNRTSTVRVRFSLLPVRRWAQLPIEMRRRMGIIGGAGVSVVRAGREVDFGWYLMGAKRRENYDDWWRCEIRFEPELDEYFGITHSKQGVTPHLSLVEAMAPDLERIARVLNAKVRGEFQKRPASRRSSCRSQSPAGGNGFAAQKEAVRVASARERYLPTLPVSVRRYRIVRAPLSSARFYEVNLVRSHLVVTLNVEHPLFALIRANGDRMSEDLINSMLLAAARAEIVVRHGGSRYASRVPARMSLDNESFLNRFVEAWSDALAAYLGRT